MTALRPDESVVRSRQLAFDKARYRRRSNLSLMKDALIAVAILAGIGVVLIIGTSGSDLMAWR